MKDKSSELEFGIGLARKAGEIINYYFSRSLKSELKNDNTPVTIADTEINTFVIKEINKKYPKDSILAEEESDIKESKIYWVCDPIDGTIPFMHKVPVSTFTLSRVVDGEPTLGIIYDPFQDRMYTAESGKGAWLNDKRISVSKTNSIKGQDVGIVFWKGNDQLFGKLISLLAREKAKMMNLVSIAYMDAMVASGELAATIFPGENPHDSAASNVVIEEAGGVFTSIYGKDQRYDQKVDGHLAAGSEIHNKILNIIKGM